VRRAIGSIIRRTEGRPAVSLEAGGRPVVVPASAPGCTAQAWEPCPDAVCV
jgi:hypothetical protein